MRVLYGTTNAAKLDSMRQAVKGLGLEVIGLKDLGQPIPKVDESGKDPLVNAELKARAYYEAFHLPVFSCDSGLFFEEFEPAELPGTHVRGVNGRELTDEEMKALRKGAGEMSAKMRAVRIVSASNVSKRDLEQRLIHKGEDPKQAKQAVEWMSELNLLDDAKTAEQVVHSCIRKGYGLARAKQALYE